MIRNITRGFAAALMAVTAATSMAGAAQAATPLPALAAAPPALAAPSPKAVALARRYMAAIHFNDTMRQVMDPVLKQLLQGVEGGDRLPPDMRKALLDSAHESFDDFMPRMMDAMVPIMAQVYTEAELQGLVDFYEGPVGQALIAKTPQLSAAMSGMIPGMANDLKYDMLGRFCGKIKCTPDMRKELGLPEKPI